MAPGEVFYLYRQKTLLDTSIYISSLAHGRYPDLHEKIRSRYILYLSSVVFSELAVGHRTKREREELEKLKEGFKRKERVLVPSDQDWEEAGWILSRMVEGEKGHRIAMTHDILIALSARSIGATVITENRRDFERIRRYKDFSLEIWPTPP